MKVLYGLVLAAVVSFVAAPSSADTMWKVDGVCYGPTILGFFGVNLDCSTAPDRSVHMEAGVGNDGVLKWIEYSDHVGLGSKDVCDADGICETIFFIVDQLFSFGCVPYTDASGETGCGSGGGGAGSLVGAPPGEFFLTIGDGFIQTFNGGDGLFTDYSSCGFGCWHTVQFTLGAWEQVPEPATLALLSIGLAGLGFWRRKQ